MKITVYKYDPSTDAAPYYVSGEIEYRESMTALEALQAFHENVEAVNFDYSCACRLCGRCAMMIDGQAALACVYPIEDADHTFEPLQGYPVVRDLVVDKTEFDNELTDRYERIRIEDYDRSTLEPENYDPSTRDDIYHIEFCSRCGVCASSCPVFNGAPDQYVGPATMLATAYRFMDPLDQGDRVMEAVHNGLYRCIKCGMCDQVCPQQDIEHLKMWDMLRSAAEERGIVPSYAQ